MFLQLTIFGLILVWTVVLVGGWLSWQLLRQNGRLLLRVEELEQRLDELTFAEPGDENPNGAQGTGAPYPDDRASRFNKHSLAKSKLKRDGLKAGTPAPGFCLPRLDGRGELALTELRGRRVLLVFSDPHCGPCNALAPELERFHRQNKQDIRPPSPLPSPPGEGELSPALEVLMISRGEPKDNRAKVREHRLTFPVVLQQQWEISRRYAMFATPIAYLIDETGVISQDVAVGSDAIRKLMDRAMVPCAEVQEVA
jgi:peroxiredoxin